MTEGKVLFFETFEISRMMLLNTSNMKRTSLTNVPGSTNRVLVYNNVLFSKGREYFPPVPLCCQSVVLRCKYSVLCALCLFDLKIPSRHRQEHDKNNSGGKNRALNKIKILYFFLSFLFLITAHSGSWFRTAASSLPPDWFNRKKKYPAFSVTYYLCGNF